MIGSKVFAVNDDGDAEALQAGSYTMENGNKLTIGENSEILDLGEEKEAEDVEASEEEMSEELSEEVEESKEEELAEDDEAAVDDWAGMEKRIKNLEDAVADLKADKVEASAELSEEDEKTEMSKEVMGELMTQIEELKSKIVELSGQPADEGITYSPEGMRNATPTVDLGKLSISERTAYYINNK
jgi:chromosome segregation ATPase